MNERGFTVPELVTVLTVSGLFAGLILFFGFSYWRYGSLLEADLDVFVSRLNAGDYLRENLSSSSGMITQNSIEDPNTNTPDPLLPSNLYWEPVHAIPGNKPVDPDGAITPLVYFRRPSQNTSGEIVMNGEQPYQDEYILYLNGTTRQLLARSLANPFAPANRLLTSCPAALATASCPADRIIMSDLASVDVRYFSRTGNLIDYTSITDTVTGEYIGPDFPVVDVVEFTLNASKKPVFQKTNATVNSTVIRIALRNT